MESFSYVAQENGFDALGEASQGNLDILGVVLENQLAHLEHVILSSHLEGGLLLDPALEVNLYLSSAQKRSVGGREE